MNDRYLFKAKRKNWKELPEKYWWVYWNIFSGCPETIDESTICACTGLKDKNGTLIWENDIAEISKEDGYFSIDWDEDAARFVMNGDGLTVDFDNYWSHEVEVAGNRVDNPELLEVER